MLERKAVYATMITLSFLLLSVWTQSNMVVMANPIPVPVLLMPYEYINVTLSMANANMQAKVNGSYPFLNDGVQKVNMYYPVPPDSTAISVEMDATSLIWAYNTEIYPTVLGDWPMINWTISPVPNEFSVNTHYEHAVPFVSGSYMFLYAMGTGKYLPAYPKVTTAFVRIRMEASYTNLQVQKILYHLNGTYTYTPADYTIVKEGATDVITLTVTSEWSRPMLEDLLITFSTGPGDINGDGKVDIKDLAIVAMAYGSYPIHPRWNSIADVNQDSRIDIRDLALVASNFGQTYP